MVYALVLAAVLVASVWISFSRFILGRSLEVPDMSRLSVEEAVTLAAARGLRVVPDAARADYDEGVAAQRIRGQVPAAGTAVKAGQTVRVFLSLGPRTIRVPDLGGSRPRTAALALERAGLAAGVVSAARADGPPGIVAQGVAPGTVTTPGTPVDVLVTRGAPEVSWVMPDLIGRDFERVRLAFEARGFRLGGVRSQTYEGAAAGTILRQFPLAGYPVTLKDTLSFVVASTEGPAS